MMATPPDWEAASCEQFANGTFEYRLERLLPRVAAAAIWHLTRLSSSQHSACHKLLGGLSEAVAEALLKVTAPLRFHSLANRGRPTANEIESMLLRHSELLD
jgi:hypothetical protein